MKRRFWRVYQGGHPFEFFADSKREALDHIDQLKQCSELSEPVTDPEMIGWREE